MKAPVAVALLVLMPALSGCLGDWIGPRAAAPGPTPAVAWRPVPWPQPLPDPPVLQFWVPTDATGLRMYWPASAEFAGPSPADKGHTPAGSVFTEAPPSVRVFGPEGVPLHPALREITALDRTMVIPEPLNATLAVYYFADDEPTPGAYLVVLYGDLPPPHVEVRLAVDQHLATMQAAPFVFQRVLLHEGGGAGGFAADGTFDVPPQTVFVYGDLLGFGTSARLDLKTAAGTIVATTEAMLVGTGPGTRELTLGLDPSRLTRRDAFFPAELDGGPITFELSGEGDGTAFAIVGTAHTTSSPAAAIAGGTAFLAPSVERTPLSGDIFPWTARWFTMPDEARLLLEPQSSSEGAAAHYRIYDAAGRRVQWGEATFTQQALPLPPGPLAIINDGPYTLTATVLGTPPADAALHEPRVHAIAESHTLEALDGFTVSSSRIFIGGPVVTWTVRTTGPLLDLQASLETVEGVPLANAPDLRHSRPGETPCCSFPFFSSLDADPYWLDGGTYRLRTSASAGQGQAENGFAFVDLTSLGVPSA